MTTTYQDITERTGIAIPPHLEVQATPPVISTGWRQGDVYIRSEDHEPKGDGLSIAAGIRVVQGDADRNSHVLIGDGLWHPGSYRDAVLDYGLLVVPDGGEAWLQHTGEHGAVCIPEGTWRLWGQRSHEAEISRAAD